MKTTRQDLLMLWRFSRFESVREVAQNPDILKLILTELEPMFQYNHVMVWSLSTMTHATKHASNECSKKEAQLLFIQVAASCM